MQFFCASHETIHFIVRIEHFKSFIKRSCSNIYYCIKKLYFEIFFSTQWCINTFIVVGMLPQNYVLLRERDNGALKRACWINGRWWRETRAVEPAVSESRRSVNHASCGRRKIAGMSRTAAAGEPVDRADGKCSASAATGECRGAPGRWAFAGFFGEESKQWILISFIAD
jgi:hypothetical protein